VQHLGERTQALKKSLKLLLFLYMATATLALEKEPLTVTHLGKPDSDN